MSTNASPARRPKAGKPPAKSAPSHSRKRLYWTLAGCAAVLAIILAVALLPGLLGPNRTPEAVLNRYFTGLYTGAPLDDLAACFPEQMREEFELVYSFGGIGTTMVTMYRQQAQELVGENVSVKVKLSDRSKPSAQELNQAKQTFPQAESATTVSFDIRLTGAKGSSTISGATQLVRISGKWYLTDYNISLHIN